MLNPDTRLWEECGVEKVIGLLTAELKLRRLTEIAFGSKFRSDPASGLSNKLKGLKTKIFTTVRRN